MEGRIEIKSDGDVAIMFILHTALREKGKAPNLYREVLDEYFDINWNEVNDEPNDSGEGEEQDVEAINAERYMRGDLFEVKEGEKINFKRGMLFEDVKHFREVLKDYAIEKGFKLVRDKNEKVRVTAHCGSDGCEWRIHASPLPDGCRGRKNVRCIGLIERPWSGLKVAITGLMLSYLLMQMRPFIGVDGCHLKGPYGGVLLSAVALDGDSGLYPLAFAILPEAHHRRCCRHLFNNFKSKFPGLKLRRQFWAAARAYNEVNFKFAMEQIQAISKDPVAWMMQLPLEQWARHRFDPRVKSDHITNNLVESPLTIGLEVPGPNQFLSLVDSIRVKMMGMLHKKFEKGNTWPNRVAPTVMKKLVKIKQDARLCKVTFGGGEAYEVMDEGKINIVNLGTRTCYCKMWDISGVPCKHATDIIHPIHDESMWPEAPGDAVQPPPLRNMLGRLKKNRVRKEDEGAAAISIMRRSNTVRGWICKEIGHNKKTCQRAPVRGGKRKKNNPKNHHGKRT
ncbi:hypothetical protein Acr_00g0056250 [Actinidia rufa]|uniref:SWIM-type domain-containing protein n=1 Tax=Actinidia rufa TaxID=165716 RepID=A0A7J0DP51_9ERIC|nr:hypothetical protein Acr_00g0056250 [Actinidia rufa]